MFDTLAKTIYTRKSFRSYEKTVLDADTLKEICGFIGGIKPLYPEIRVSYEILSKDSISCILPWKTEQAVAIYTEKSDDAYVNAGFMFQQLDLYLQSKGCGCCWLGMGKPKSSVKTKDGLEYVIMLAFGTPKGDEPRSDISQFNRKKLSEISDTEDSRLDAARVAPSACNSQPWYFTHEGDIIHAYRKSSPILADMNKIDMGIVLSHLYVANSESFEFFKAEAPEIKGCVYTGSFRI